MENRKSIIATLGLACALGAGMLLGAAPADGSGAPPAGGNTAPKQKQSGQDAGKDKHAGHDHSKDKASGGEKKAPAAVVGQKAPEFQFKDFNGKSHSLAEFSGKTVVLEWMNPGCPVCKRKVESGEVAKMMAAAKAADPNVVFIFVNSTNTEMGGSAEGSAKYLKDNKIDAIGFFEADGAVGRLFGARTTPHLFVINPQGVLAYSGAIDDAEGDKKGVNFVVEAVKAIKAGNAPSPSTTKPYGCSVKYAKQ